MREAIEKVVEELRQEQLNADHGYVAARDDMIRGYYDGYGVGIEQALCKLLEVLSQHGTNDGSSVPGDVGEEAAQIPSEENGS